jgi:uncharacterized protein (TIGR02145 family)
MKSTSGLWVSPNTGATNSSKFSGIPGGAWISNLEDFGGLGNVASFWSSTVVPQTQGNAAFAFALVFDGEDLEFSQLHKDNAICIRCLRD